MKNLFLVMSFFLASCASLPQHVGSIPEDVSSSYYQDASEQDTDLAEITCASGERQYYFLGTSKPQMVLKFDDGRFSIFKRSYESVKLKPMKADFSLIWSFNDKFANLKVKDFEFKKNTKYFAMYSTNGGRIAVWIETEAGEVVYGKKPAEGRFL